MIEDKRGMEIANCYNRRGAQRYTDIIKTLCTLWFNKTGSTLSADLICREKDSLLHHLYLVIVRHMVCIVQEAASAVRQGTEVNKSILSVFIISRYT